MTNSRVAWRYRGNAMEVHCKKILHKMNLKDMEICDLNHREVKIAVLKKRNKMQENI